MPIMVLLSGLHDNGSFLLKNSSVLASVDALTLELR